MTNDLEFSDFYKLLYAVKEGEDSKKDNLISVLSNFKSGEEAESFLQELGQTYLHIGVEELFIYAGSEDLHHIGQLSKEEWDSLAKKQNCDLPVQLANKMINYVKGNGLIKKLASKWGISRREVEKHIRPMSAYITEGLIDVLE